MRVDAHHNLWNYNPNEYSWIDESLVLLRRDFTVEEFEAEAAAVGVEASVAVHAQQTLDETRWLLQVAERSRLIRGVVGWAPLAADDIEGTLENLRGNPLLRGLRHVAQGEPHGFLNGRQFNRGVGLLRGTGLVYDIVVYAEQLSEATRFVDRHPEQPFVLDHIGRPDIRGHEFALWEAAIRDLALRQNVTCKVSAMVTAADWNHWTPEQLEPYFDTILEAFGPGRMMAGSDWPMLTLAATYGRWWGLLDHFMRALTCEERRQMEGEVATRTYRLEPKKIVAGAA